MSSEFVNRIHSGAVFNPGTLIMFWPYDHPCHEPYDQWIVFWPDGSAEVVTELPADLRPSEATYLGTMPGMAHVGHVTIE